MILTLLAVSLNDQNLSQPITAHFDSRGGTIGRADHNTMALPDPERHVSRMQAELIASGGGYLIRNVGTANPILVAGRSVGTGETSPLADGDEIRVGGYVLHAELRADDVAREVTRGRAMLTHSQAAKAPASAPAQPVVAAVAPPPAAAIATPAAQLSRPPVAPPAYSPPAARAADNPFADLLGPSYSDSPAAPGSATAPVSDPFADLLSPAPARASAATHPVQADASDPFAGLLGPPLAPPAAPPAAKAASPNPAPAAPEPAAPPRPAADPFADFMPQAAGLGADSRALSPKSPAPAANRLPDDFDPFASLPGSPAGPAHEPTPAPAPASGTNLFEDLLPQAPAASSIDALFGLGLAADDTLANFMADPVPAPSSAPSSPTGKPSSGAGISTDPLQALFGDLGAPAGAPAQSDHLPALNAAYVPPRQSSPPVAAAAAAPVSPPPPIPAAPRPPAGRLAAGDASSSWAALCEGAGVNLPMPAHMSDEQWRKVGQLLRSAVEGSVRLMAVRASTKHELRAEVTVIQARDNNPLKFSPDAHTALEYLLQPPARGFLDGPAAMEDAMQDLVGHAIGTVVGMRAAIDGMLDRFAPQALESKLTSKSVLDSVLPAQRKAKLWDLYVQHHQTIRTEAQEDFHTLFGKAFLAAYEQQIEQLKSGAPPA